MVERVAVIDYGMGNLRSVSKAVEHVAGKRFEVVVTDDVALIRDSDRLVFPGQGAVRDCMAAIREHALESALRDGIASKPFLGICMGMQVLMERSDEHPETDCLGILPGGVRRFYQASPSETQERLTVPQMGWNQVFQSRDHPLWDGIGEGERFYFANSYYVAPASEEIVTGHTSYGIEFASAIGRDNLFAVQFHPEKSARPGLRFLENFLRW